MEQISDKPYKTAIQRVGLLHYNQVHVWLNKNYGKADKCNMCHLDGKNYHWCLKTGMEYAFNPDNFIQLCVSCHRKYDFNEDVAKRISETLMGHTQPQRYVPIIRIGANGDQTEYEAIAIAAKKTGILRTSILNCLAGRTGTAGKFQWKYKCQI